MKEYRSRHNRLLRVITILILTSFTFQQASFADISYKITHDALSTGNIGDGQAPNAGEVDKTTLAARPVISVMDKRLTQVRLIKRHWQLGY